MSATRLAADKSRIAHVLNMPAYEAFAALFPEGGDYGRDHFMVTLSLVFRIAEMEREIAALKGEAE